MELKLDPSIPYALALEGGGAKGAYQIGAWKALKEAGIRFSAVAGTSVGALNGSLIVMDDMEKAENVWQNIRYSQVMKVDDEEMSRLVKGDLHGLDLKSTAAMLREVLTNRGLDVGPLYAWIREVVDEDAIRASATELYIVTYSVTDHRELELRARDLPAGTVVDMLLASAYLPVFRNEKLLGKRFADGGVRDVLPLHALFSHGYRDIIALRLFGFGVERPVRVPRDARLHLVEPTMDLGGTLDFEAGQSRANLKTGYYDAQRMLYGLRGTRWYVDSRWSEDRAYAFLAEHIRPYLTYTGREVSLRKLNESVLPAMARRLDARKDGYCDLLTAFLEEAAEKAGLDRWHIYTEDELVDKVRELLRPEAYPETLAEALAERKLPSLLL